MYLKTKGANHPRNRAAAQGKRKMINKKDEIDCENIIKNLRAWGNDKEFPKSYAMSKVQPKMIIAADIIEHLLNFINNGCHVRAEVHPHPGPGKTI